MTLAAVMPLPEGMPELAFAGALGRPARAAVSTQTSGLPHRRRRRLLHQPAPSIRQAACPKARSAIISATTAWRIRFPVLTRRARLSSARTRSGRSRSSAGRRRKTRASAQLIHELTGPIIPTVVPGVHAVHAVDAAGVHPLLLAIGSERYVPYAERSASRRSC